MQWLAALCVSRPVFATVLILSLTVVGAFAFTRLGVDRFPKVDFPTVVVTTRLPGAAPEQIETEITDKIEEAVNTISGIDELRSISSEGVSQVIIAFLLEKDTDVAAQEVRDKVNRVLPLLPRTIEQPRVEKFDPDAAPVLTLALTRRTSRSATSPSTPTRCCAASSRASAASARCSSSADAQRQINVWLDADRLRAYNLTVTDVVARAAGAEHRDPRRPRRAGRRSRSRCARAAASSRSPSSATSSSASRTATRSASRDVARVEDGDGRRRDDRQRQRRAGTVLLQRPQAVGHQHRRGRRRGQGAARRGQAAAAAGLRASASSATCRSSSRRRSTASRSTCRRLDPRRARRARSSSANLRSTIIAAIAIPTSIIATFGLIWYMGFTLNSMTMLALTLAVGIVIDDAIVVLENIYRFIEEKGTTPMQAAVEATREIGLAVLATTLSLVAIFVPVGFMGGIVGRFMKSFGLTMAFAIMVSLLVSFTLTPMLSARWLKVEARTASDDSTSSKDSRVFHADRRVLHAACSTGRWRIAAIVAGVAVLVLLSSVPLFMMANKNFLPQDDQSEFEVNLRAPEGTSLEATEVHRQPDRRRAIRAAARRSTTRWSRSATIRRKTRNLGDDLRPAEADRGARARSVRGDGRRPQRDPADARAPNLRTSVQPVATIGGGGSAERRHPVRRSTDRT